MKIAIQGHPDRGKEVIQILKSLGGINTWNYLGNNFDCYYEIHGNTIICACTKSNNYKYYTLEEFEKEFPFKIGDRVISLTTGLIGTITKLSENGIYHFKYDNGICSLASVSYLKLYKEMKEERNVTLTLDKAKEWYNKGGELREIALQAFTEKELNPLPRSWEEFCKNYPKAVGEAFVDTLSIIFCNDVDGNKRDISKDRNFCPSKKSAEAHLAMIQLEQLRDCWRNGWEPDWLDGNTKKYAIKSWRDKSSIEITYVTHAFLSFPTYKLALEFEECFKDLIEKAGDLI